jgi:hypothetical protein
MLAGGVASPVAAASQVDSSEKRQRLPDTALFLDKKSLHKWILESPEGDARIIDVLRKNRHEFA